MRKICGVSISRQVRRRTSTFKLMVFGTMGDGISELTPTRVKTPRGDTNYPTAILKRFTAVPCFVRKAELDNINMLTLNRQQPISTECLSQHKGERRHILPDEVDLGGRIAKTQ